MHRAGPWWFLGAMLASGAIALPVVAAQAQGPVPVATRAERPALHYTRAPGSESCIGPAEIARGVEAIVGPVLRGSADADVILEATASCAPGGFVLYVRLLDGRERELGRRALPAKEADCRALDALWTFVIALMLDPSAALMALPPELEAAIEGESAGALLLAELRNETETRHAEPLAPAERPDTKSAASISAKLTEPDDLSAPATTASSTSLAARARLAVGPVWGVGPGVSAAASLGIDLTRKFWLVRARAAGWLPRTVTLDGASGPRVRSVGGQFTILFGPAEFELGSLRVQFAAGAFAGLLHAQGGGVSQPENALRPTYGAAIEAGLRWPFSRRVSLSIDLAVQWNVRRDRFYVTSTPPQRDHDYRLPVAALAAWLGVVFTPLHSALR